MGFLDKIKSLFNSELTEKEKYYLHKKELEETALADTVFWDKTDNIDTKELNKRKKFLKLWEQAVDLINVNFGQNKTKNMQEVIMTLQLGNNECFYNNKVWRDFRLLEGQIQLLYGTIPQATNCFMQILYLDMIDNATNNFNFVIAPKIYKWAFQENLPIENFEKIFKFNAENIIKSAKFEISITPEEAWGKILEYRNLKENL